jgi:pimeloyl-ACP methyl ester carboxylesterase
MMDALKIQKAVLVTHDIGNMVGYPLAAQYPARITKWVVIDAPLPGIANWDEVKQSPLLWHFNFRGPDEERLVAGRERCPPIRKRSTRRRGSIMPRSMPGRMPCMTRSSSSVRSTKTASTTRQSSSRATS